MRFRALSAALLLSLVVVPIMPPWATPPAHAATLRWAASRDIGSLDPDSFGDTFTLAFLNHVYEALVRYDENLKVEPALATSWSWSSRPSGASTSAPTCIFTTARC